MAHWEKGITLDLGNGSKIDMLQNKEEKEAVDGGSKAPSTVEASRGEKEAVAVDGEKEAIAVGGEKKAVAVGGRSKAAAADERHHSVVMHGRSLNGGDGYLGFDEKGYKK
ncbi:hypothetical protein L1887_12283 [Cichorium endivia]|nr:hypothetical protein L1887_12283 [Cichorium endivia]